MQNVLVDHPIDETQQKVVDFIHSKEFKIFSIIDQRAEAVNVGLEIPATRLIIFGNPKVGTLLMQENDDITFELPSKVLLIAKVDQTKLIYLDPDNFPGVDQLKTQGKQIIEKMHNMYIEMVKTAQE